MFQAHQHAPWIAHRALAGGGFDRRGPNLEVLASPVPPRRRRRGGATHNPDTTAAITTGDPGRVLTPPPADEVRSSEAPTLLSRIPD